MLVSIAIFTVVLVLKTPWASGSRAVGPLTSVNAIYDALQEPSIDQVMLGDGFFELNSLSTWPSGGGLVIGPNRNVELVGSLNVLNIVQSLEQNWPEVALEYGSGINFGSTSQGLFRLGDNTTLGFRNLILVHGLSQLGYDWQVVSLLQPGARAAVRFTQTVKLRDACLPLHIFQQHVISYTRLANRPGQQSVSLQPFCFGGAYNAWPGWGAGDVSNISNVTCVSETLAITDLATSITRSNGQSYNLYEQNSSYWCHVYASMSCLTGSGPEQCVRDLLTSNSSSNSTLSAGAGTTASNSRPPENQGNGLTNILLPAVLTGSLTIAFVTATLWCVRRRRAATRGSSLAAHAEAAPGQELWVASDMEGGMGGEAAVTGRSVGARVGGALSRLLPGVAAREAQQRRKPHVPGYLPVVSKEAVSRIAKFRAELSSKMVVASSTDDLSDVRNLCLVGKGTFGRVYKGEWKGVTVALKVISVPVSQCGQAQWQQVLGEAAISTLLNHPCVLQTYSVALLEFCPAHKLLSSTSDGGGSPSEQGAASGEKPPQPPQPLSSATPNDVAQFYQLKMVSQFCEGGSVVEALRGVCFYASLTGGPVRLAVVLDIASQVASGMMYLHSGNIIHADLKAANVLLMQRPGSGRLQAKVGDFGLSFRMEESEATHATKGQLGSITHMAPEVLLLGRVSKASDVYSFGVLLYELYTGEPAYSDVPQPMLAYHVATSGGRPVLPHHCPPTYRGIAKACWAAEPSARPSFDEVYQRLKALAEDIQKPQNLPTALAAQTLTANTIAPARVPQPRPAPNIIGPQGPEFQPGALHPHRHRLSAADDDGDASAAATATLSNSDCRRQLDGLDAGPTDNTTVSQHNRFRAT